MVRTESCRLVGGRSMSKLLLLHSMAPLFTWEHCQGARLRVTNHYPSSSDSTKYAQCLGLLLLGRHVDSKVINKSDPWTQRFVLSVPKIRYRSRGPARTRLRHLRRPSHPDICSSRSWSRSTQKHIWMCLSYLKIYRLG